MQRLENALSAQPTEGEGGTALPCEAGGNTAAETESGIASIGDGMASIGDGMAEDVASDGADCADENRNSQTDYAEDYETDGGNEGNGENTAENPEDSIDYAALAREDLRTLSEEFPELRGIDSITRLPNALRYGELRDMGLSAREAYLATGRIAPKRDNRSHLHSSVPRGAGGGGSSMSYSELCQARELFSSLSDADIQKLYKRVKI